MKRIFFSIALFVSFVECVAQTNTVVDSTYEDLIHLRQINGIDVLYSDTFNRIIQTKLSGRRTDEHTAHPRVYFSNKEGDKYLEIWGGPDLGYGWFFTIGYTKNGKCTDCGLYLSKDNSANYIVDNEIRLGDDLRDIWGKAHLVYFRQFTFNGVEHYYFEKGVKHEIPFVPMELVYYKFRKNKLIEIGFGLGMDGVNPMLSSE